MVMIRSLFTTMNSRVQSVKSLEEWSYFQERDSSILWNLLDSTTKQDQTRTQVTLLFMNFISLQTFGSHSSTMQHQSKVLEWMLWRMLQKTLKKLSKNLTSSTTKPDKLELQWSWSKLFLVPQPCERKTDNQCIMGS